MYAIMTRNVDWGTRIKHGKYVLDIKVHFPNLVPFLCRYSV